jgi:hypothetical protein
MDDGLMTGLTRQMIPFRADVRYGSKAVSAYAGDEAIDDRYRKR